ncbi:MAG: cytochrome P450 [Acidobacteriota bacterium]
MTSNQTVADPYPHYADLRRRRPIHKTPQGRWIVSRHGLAVALLADPRCVHWGRGGEGGGVERSLGAALHALAPGGPAPYRQAAGRSFVPGSGPADGALCLLAKLRDRPGFDLVNDFAHPLTCGGMCKTLGVPDSDHGEWSRRLARSGGSYLRLIGAGPGEAGEDEDAWLLEALRALVESKRRCPGDDLTSRLVEAARKAAPGAARAESDGFLLDLMLLLFYAGHQNMVNFLALAARTLIRHPGFARLVRLHPDRLPDAVLELMRYDSPVQYLPLVAREALEVEGQQIEPGDEIMICVGAANRDPEVFEEPERLDLDRRPRQQLSFGWGPSRCLGAQLAIRRGASALGALLAATKSFSLTGEPLRWRSQPAVQRGLEALPLSVVWSA